MSTDTRTSRTSAASVSGNAEHTHRIDDIQLSGDFDDLLTVVAARDDFLTDDQEDVNSGAHPDGGIVVRVSLMEHFEGLEIPKYQTDLASGFDVPAAISEPISLNTIGATALIPTGIKLEIPPGFEAQVRPRSGLAAKHGITVTNTPGTIDADYRGEIKVSLTKVNMSGGRFKVERGMRIAQIVICPVVQPPLQVVSDLSQTARGENGFGSTGIN